LAYNPFDELINSLIKHNDKLSDNLLSNLWVSQKLDIVVRTSGEFRLSNFLPLQSSYAELFFLQKHINDITKHDLENVLIEYSLRKRRYGK